MFWITGLGRKPPIVPRTSRSWALHAYLPLDPVPKVVQDVGRETDGAKSYHFVESRTELIVHRLSAGAPRPVPESFAGAVLVTPLHQVPDVSWALGGRGLLEIPVTTVPGLKTPVPTAAGMNFVAAAGSAGVEENRRNALAITRLYHLPVTEVKLVDAFQAQAGGRNRMGRAVGFRLYFAPVLSGQAPDLRWWLSDLISR